jgi:flagellar biosynthesis protein FlhF
MRIDRFSGVDVPEALDRLRAQLGEDALLLHTRAGGEGVEVLATTEAEVERFGNALRSAPLQGRPGRRSRVIALVGPTGSGKTTTAAKLALSDGAFAGSRVGIISLDTYKIGAFDQIQTYADLGGLPLEVLSDAAEVPAAMSRLGRCDVIIVDTPGRTPLASVTESSWQETLAAVEPDEVHLVLSGAVRDEVADGVVAHYAALGLTHVLLTKLDEIPGEEGVAQLADRVRLPARWITDGQNVPDDLYLAPDRLVSAALSDRSIRAGKAIA